ncbi:MAG: hypothetical protein ABEK00_02425 [Candidatus Nanohaloarchaea archaeon]
MVWYAFENADEAAKRTRELLLPFDWRLWARIAVMALFVGGFTAPSFGSGDIGGFDGGLQQFDPGASLNPQFWTGSIPEAVLLMILAGFAVVSIFGVLRSVFGFVFYQSLMDNEVRIRSNFRKHLWKGFKLFVFELSALLVLFSIGLALFLPIYLSPVFILIAVLAGLPLLLVSGVFFQFTTDFIPLFMIENDQGVLESWKDLYSLALDEWRQLGLYFIVKLVLGAVIEIVIASVSFLMLLLMVVPVGAVSFLLYLVFKPLALIPVVVAALTLVFIVLYFLRGPATTFLRYYSLLVYDDVTQEESVLNS